MNNKGQATAEAGQAVMSEYVLIFFVVIATVVGMTVFVQRGIEARVHDARNFLINSVNNSSVCDANCLSATGAAGNQIPYEYEPYYAQVISDVARNQLASSNATTGNAADIGVVYTRSTNEATTTISASSQAPPCASENPVPSWCH